MSCLRGLDVFYAILGCFRITIRIRFRDDLCIEDLYLIALVR